MPVFDASSVAALLAEYGQRTALRGGNPYRARAYGRAAENLMALAMPLEDVIATGQLMDIPGVGEAIADIITTLHRTGTHPSLESMRRETPGSVLEMLGLPGIAPDKIAKIHRELDIASLAELETAARQGRIAKTKGLGAALERKILQGLEIRRSSQGQRHVHRAAQLLAAAEANLKSSDLGLKRIIFAGDFRRGCELVSDLSIVAEAPSIRAAKVIQSGAHLTVHVAGKGNFGSVLLFATGAERHVQQLQQLAATQGFKLEADGLRRSRRVVAGKNEEGIYRALGLPFIAPELREGRGEIEMARRNALPSLVSDEDIRGVLHAHTDQSDGGNTLAEMAEATRRRGYAYFGVTDHSQSAHYAGGLKVEEIEAQHAEIDRLNRQYGGTLRILKGIESDIRPDGSLDYPDEILARFDFIVASVHGQFRLDRKAQTARMVRAVGNPYTTILGHITGRQLLRRPGYDVDIEAVLAACAKHRVAVEINSNPWRLELDWRWHATALGLGCMLSINPDAHAILEIDYMHWGVELARKGMVPKDRVLNCVNLPELCAYFAGRREDRTSSRSRRAASQVAARKVAAASQARGSRRARIGSR